ncbi:MAG: prolyl oligopeptidase family serine peptidase [Planctomycetota bacterium]|nr:prolyl oligopeptidase family serine peptidase [Planctomycetota bacterium]
MMHTLWFAICCAALTGNLMLTAAAQGRQPNAERVRPPTSSPLYQRHDFTTEEGAKLTYFLMKPRDYDEEQAYPLVLALHGRGGSTTAATTLAGRAMRKAYPCFVLAPVSPRPARWATRPGRARDDDSPQKLPAVFLALAALQKQYSIDPDRIYVTGQSMGGTGSFGAVAARPDLFAAAAPVCGSWDAEGAKNMADVPFWIFHGDKDEVVPVQRSRVMNDALQKAGAQPKYTEYAGVGHNSWNRAYASDAFWRWLFDQKRPQADKTKENERPTGAGPDKQTGRDR